MTFNHYGMSQGQTLSGAFARGLGGEERLKNPRLDLLGNSCPGILDRDFRPIPVFSGGNRDLALAF